MPMSIRTPHRLLIGVTVASNVLLGCTATAFAEPPPDYSRLAADPNLITDSTAYIALPPRLNPDGLAGVEQSFTHRDDSRTITDTVLVLADPPAAVAELHTLQAELSSSVLGATTQSAPVGENGTIASGASPDGSQSVSVLLFNRGTTTTEIRFVSGPDDPAPTDLIVEYGQRQDDAIQDQLNQ